MLHAKFQDNRTTCSVEEGFFYILAWRPSLSWDLDHLYKLSFTFPKEDPHDI